VQALYSAESFQQQLACPGSVVLPRDPARKGGGWKEKMDTGVAGGHARMTVETRATYQGEAERGDKKLAEIALEPAAIAVERARASGLGPFTLKEQEGKGSVLFDNDKGRLVETEVSQTVALESSPPGQNEKIVWKMKLSLSAKLVPPSTRPFTSPAR
jgi:hypothetical protein